jgi:hypothetical protein
MVKVETRYCPLNRTKCTGKLCALTGYQVVTMLGTGETKTEWICDMTDRVVERT